MTGKYNEDDYSKIVPFIHLHLRDTKYSSVCKQEFKCPCCYYTRSVYHWEKTPLIHLWDHGLRSHIEAQIRLCGSKEHIALLIEIVGKEKALEILNQFANKNILIGLALKGYILKLKSELAIPKRRKKNGR